MGVIDPIEHDVQAHDKSGLMRSSPAPQLSDVERRNRLERAAAKAPEYGIEMLAPGQP